MIDPVTFAIRFDRSKASLSQIRDETTGQAISIPRGNPAQFRIGIFEGSSPVDCSNITSINLRAQPSQTENAPVIDQSIASTDPLFDNLISLSQWEDGSAANAVIELTGPQTNIDLAGEKSRSLHLVITAFVDLEGEAEEVTLGIGTIAIVEDNNAAADPPPENPGTAATLADLNAAIAGSTGNLSTNTPQTLTPTQKAQLAENWPEAVASPDSNALILSAPRFRDKLNRIDRGNTPENLTVLVIGDSMTQKGLSPLFLNRLSLEVGEAGRGFSEFRHIAADPGLVTFPSNNSPLRPEVFGTGITMELRNGANVSIGPQYDASFTAPYQLDTIKVFFARENGAGTFEIWTSTAGTNTPDDAAFPGSWTLQATVNADNSGSLAGGVETVSLAENAYCVKIVVTSGTVDLVGALFINSTARGVIRANTGLGGVDVDAQWIQQDSGVLNTFLADIDPDLILSHYSFSDEDDAAEFPTYDDQVKVASPLADRVVIGEHEQLLDDPKIALHEVHILGQVDSEDQLEYFPTSKFLTFERSSALGWTTGDSDAIHQDEAWAYLNTVFMASLGISPVPPIRWHVNEQTGSKREYRLGGTNTFLSQIFTTPAGESVSTTKRIEWIDGNGEISYWDFTRRPGGEFQIFRSINGSNDEVLTLNTDSRAYFGSESGSITARFDARVRVHEGSGAAASIGASHSSASGMVWEGWNHNSDSPLLTSSITAGGAAVFQLLNLANLQTFADDAAASSLSAGDVYKTATGTLKVKL